MSGKTITYQNARSLLEKYAFSKKRLELLSGELDFYRSILNRCRATAPDQDPNGQEQPLPTIAKTVTFIKEELDREEELCGLTFNALAAIKDPDVKSVLEDHYLKRMTLEKIGDNKFFCLTTVKKLHRKGLEAVEEYLQTHCISVNGQKGICRKQHQ